MPRARTDRTAVSVATKDESSTEAFLTAQSFLVFIQPALKTNGKVFI